MVAQDSLVAAGRRRGIYDRDHIHIARLPINLPTYLPTCRRSFASAAQAARKEEGESRDKQKKADWWRDTTYQGKTFLPLSTGADKVRLAIYCHYYYYHSPSNIFHCSVATAGDEAR